MNLAYVLALITFIGWGSGDLFTIVVTRNIGASLTTFWTFVFGFIISLVVLLFVPHDISGLTIPLLILNLFLGVLLITGNVLISEAFRISSAPLVGIIIQSFPAVVLVLSTFVYGDVVTLKQWFFIAIIFIGVFLCSVDLKQLLSAKVLIDHGTRLALIATICLSIFFTFSRTLISAYGWFLPSFIATLCFPLILIFMRSRKEKFIAPPSLKLLFFTLMIALLIRSADFALNYGLSIPGASSIVAPIAGAAPILFVILSSLIFKDKVSKQQIGGIAVTLLGIMLLTLNP
ncbi:DMT family transporter [candidate division WWE3 bacterium]|uniref:DMT family transporter n=1 Tax=candidate division WWE3 bacterium TaxID=2053526 RepID=A0A955RQZ8_UNCKA|nr:DMT family transporter [candidate division WWE3 bacterium]